MATIQSVRDIPVKALVIGEGQVRIRHVDREIEELAESIKLHGLLEPIVVCQTKQSGQYEVLMGQRRLLAHRVLGRTRIMAAIINEPVDVQTAKVLSLTENLVRAELDSRDVIDACTALYNRYGNARAVADETGLPYAKVLRHVKYDRLTPDLRTMVDSGETTLDAALKVQDALSTAGEMNDDEARELATSLAGMTNAQQRKILQAKQKDPAALIATLVKEAVEGNRPRQIIVTLTAELHKALQEFAKRANSTQDEAARELLTKALGVSTP